MNLMLAALSLTSLGFPSGRIKASVFVQASTATLFILRCVVNSTHIGLVICARSRRSTDSLTDVTPFRQQPLLIFNIKTWSG